MIIPLKEIARKRRSFHRKERLNIAELFKSHNEVISTDRLEVDLHAEARQDGCVVVRGEAKTMLEYICSRCLIHFKQELVIPILEIFTDQQELVDDKEEELIHFTQQDQIDFQPFIEEIVLASLPFIPVCNDDCQGLCAQCGQDLNEQACHCREEIIDSPFEGLKQLLQD